MNWTAGFLEISSFLFHAKQNPVGISRRRLSDAVVQSEHGPKSGVSRSPPLPNRRPTFPEGPWPLLRIVAPVHRLIKRVGYVLGS